MHAFRYILRNPDTYKNPDVFDPERFLGEHPEPDPRRAVFGFGRRVCPGRFLADATLFLSCANVLAAFNVLQSEDEFGNKIVPNIKYTGATIMSVIPHSFLIWFQLTSVFHKATLSTSHVLLNPALPA
jgi:cytochrome P450